MSTVSTATVSGLDADPRGRLATGSKYINVIQSILNQDDNTIVELLRVLRTERAALFRTEALELLRTTKEGLVGFESPPPAVKLQHNEYQTGRGSFNQILPLEELADDFAAAGIDAKDETRACYVAPTISFATLVYIVREGERHVSLEVIRIGDSSGVSSVTWTTMDGSAKAGSSYVAGKGKLVFEAKEYSKTIEVALIQDDKWENTLEFMVDLEPESVENATLSNQAHRARVKILDDDVFPSAKYREELTHSRTNDVPKWDLLREYVKFNMSNKVVWARSKFQLKLNLVLEVGDFIMLCIEVMLVEWILKRRLPEGTRYEIPLALISCYYFVQWLGRIVGEHKRIMVYGTGGPSRMTLLDGIFRKYLEVDHSHRMRLSLSDLRSVMTRDAIGVVGQGYNSLFTIVKEMQSIAFLLCFQFVGPPIKAAWGTDPPDYSDVLGAVFFALGCMILYPFVMYIFLEKRRVVTLQALKGFHDSFQDMNSVAETTSSNFRLIADYQKRPYQADEFGKSVKIFNKRFIERDDVIRNNINFIEGVGMIMECLWILIGGLLAARGAMGVGFFLTNIKVFKQLRNSYVAIYRKLLDMEQVIPGLVRVTSFMNLPTELAKRKSVSDMTRFQMNHYRAIAELQAKGDGKPIETAHIPFMDRLPLVMGGFQFDYTYRGEKGVVEVLKELKFQGIIQIFQGQMVTITGPKGGGKATILKMFGGEIYLSQSTCSQIDFGDKATADKKGRFFVPSHLRVLHVGPPMFMDATLIDNLRFGVMVGTKDGNRQRVETIVQRIGVADEVIQMMKKEFDIEEHNADPANKGNQMKIVKHPWDSVLAPTQCQLLNLARAFIANPMVLIMHKPTQLFGCKSTKITEGLRVSTPQVANLLREFVDGRGLQQDAASIASRRPRTCIMSSTGTHEDIGLADQVYVIHTNGEIELFKARRGDEVNESALRSTSRSCLGVGGGLADGQSGQSITCTKNLVTVSHDAISV